MVGSNQLELVHIDWRETEEGLFLLFWHKKSHVGSVKNILKIHYKVSVAEFLPQIGFTYVHRWCSLCNHRPSSITPTLSLTLDIHPHIFHVCVCVFKASMCRRVHVLRDSGREEGRGVPPEKRGSSALNSSVYFWNQQLYFSIFDSPNSKEQECCQGNDFKPHTT